jgi:putative membrane protein
MTKYTIRIIPILVAAGIAASWNSRADENESSKARNESSSSTRQGPGASATDQQTQVKEAAQMNMAVIKVSELASRKAQNAQLKQFASRLQQDHKQAQKDLEQIAQKQNVTLPGTLDSKCQEEISRLESLSGAEFDREFAKGAIEGHAMAIAKLQQSAAQGSRSSGLSGQSSSTPSGQTSSANEQANAGSSAQTSSGSGGADLQQYNRKMLAKTKEHQREAREVARAVGVDQATITSLETKAQQDGVGSPGSSTQSSGKSSSSSQPGQASSSTADKSTSNSTSPNESGQKQP